MADADNTTCYYVYAHRYASGEKIGNVFYVGKGTKNRAWQKGSKRNIQWHRIVNKYGFVVEIVENGLTNKHAIEREIELIRFYGRSNLCNMTSGGEGGGIDREWTEESRRKLSESKKGKPQPWAKNSMKSEEARRKLSASKTGKKNHKISGINNPSHRPEVKAKLSARFLGVPRPDMYGAKNPSAKPVVCIETGVLFETQKAAIAWLISIGKPSTSRPSNISSAASGRLKSAYGYKWKYA